MTDWGAAGSGVVNAGADFVGGIGSAFKGLGSRFKRSRLEPFVNALCAVVGDVAAQNGRLRPEELAGFEKFLIRNCRDNNLLTVFTMQELKDKVKDYAVAAFLGETLKIAQAVSVMRSEPEFAALIIDSARCVAGADGTVNNLERLCLEAHAKELNVPVATVHLLSSVARPQLAAPAPDRTCKMCHGRNKQCPFCKGTGQC